MLRYLAENEITSIDDLKGFDADGYTYAAHLSEGYKLVFIR